MTRKLTPLQTFVLLNCNYVEGQFRRLGWQAFTEFFINGRNCTSTVHTCVKWKWIKSNTWKLPYYQRKYNLTELGVQKLIENGWTT